jgi:beta-lactamase regulating signal transducer with metallopeptidase domain
MFETSGALAISESPIISEVASISARQATQATQAFFQIAPITIIWLIGLVSVFIFFAIICFRNHKTLRFAMLIRDNDYLNQWLESHKHMRPIAIMQSDRIKSSFAVGIIKPRIILPTSLDMKDKQLLDCVLAHEYFHIKRFDALWKILLLLAVCVHWFNPMVWIMLVLANRDLELTCDEAVIRRFGAITKKAYAYMLIDMAEQKGVFAPLYSGFSKNSIQERITSIMKARKSSIASVALAVALVAMLALGALSVFAINTNSRSVDEDFNNLNGIVTDSTTNTRTGSSGLGDFITNLIANSSTTTNTITNNGITTTTSTTNQGITIQALGPVITENLQLGDFDRVKATTVWEVVYRHSESHSVVVEVNENVIDYLNVRVHRGMLHAEFREGLSFDFSRGSKPRIYVYAPYLRELNLESAAIAIDWDVLYTSEFNIQTNGASSINISMEVERLSVNSAGASNIKLTGVANTANLTFSGADNALIDMEVGELVVNNLGASNIELLGSADIASITALGVGTVVALEVLIGYATVEANTFSRVYVNALED